MIEVIAVIVVFVICAALGIYLTLPTKTSTSTSTSATQKATKGNVLTITEDGATTTSEGYMMRENYMVVPPVDHCHLDSPPEWCSQAGYDKSMNGLAIIYDTELGAKVEQRKPCDGETVCEDLPTECPGGGYDCTFIEQYDSEGTLIGMMNKSGEELLEKMADDAWAGKWNLDTWEFGAMLKREIKYEDGKLIFKKSIDDPPMKGGDELTLKVANEMGVPIVYFIALISMMQEAGEPKPDKIVLNVRGAQQMFNKRISRVPEKKDNNKIERQREKNKSKPAIVQKKKIQSTQPYRSGTYRAKVEEQYIGSSADRVWCEIYPESKELACHNKYMKNASDIVLEERPNDGGYYVRGTHDGNNWCNLKSFDAKRDKQKRKGIFCNFPESERGVFKFSKIPENSLFHDETGIKCYGEWGGHLYCSGKSKVTGSGFPEKFIFEEK